MPTTPTVAFCRQLQGKYAKGIAYSLKNYREPVDSTFRCIRDDKAGHIAHHDNPILDRLGLSDGQWLSLSTDFEQLFVISWQQSK